MNDYGEIYRAAMPASAFEKYHGEKILTKK